MFRTVAVVIAALAGASCATSEEEALSVVEETIGTCSNWDCGNDSDIWSRIPFGELDASGAEFNYAKVRIVDFRAADGTPLHFFVNGDRIAGRVKVAGESWPGTGRAYKSMEGAVLTVAGIGPRPLYRQIVIDRIGEITTWEHAPQRTAPTYRLVHGEPGTPREEMLPVCPPQTARPRPGQVDVLPGVVMDEEDAVVVWGDRYDGRTKRVIATRADVGPWFNIGCSTSVVAKLHLMRHTEVAIDSTFRPTRSERQTVLKMLTADYCGTGRSFTERGEPLMFMTRRQEAFPLPHPHFEAIWSSDGAVCLDEPRREAEETGIRADIDAVCDFLGHPVRSCASRLPEWQRHGYAVSASR
jgi:hypothetical protein